MQALQYQQGGREWGRWQKQKDGEGARGVGIRGRGHNALYIVSQTPYNAVSQVVMSQPSSSVQY